MPSQEQPEQTETHYTEKYPALAGYLTKKQESRSNGGIPERILEAMDETSFSVRSVDPAAQWVGQLYRDLKMTISLEKNVALSPEQAIKSLIKRLRRFIESEKKSEPNDIFQVEKSLLEKDKVVDDLINLIDNEIQPTFDFFVVAGYDKETQKYNIVMEVRVIKTKKATKS